MPPSWRNPQAAKSLGLVALVAAVCALMVAPAGLGLSSGATSDTIQDPNFAANGCAACHGPANAFSPADRSNVVVQIIGADGTPSNGRYEADAVYTISIQLHETIAPDAAGNHAGFNLRAGAGTLAAVEGQSQVTASGEATHINGRATSWNVTWTAPASGPVVFNLFVNDVDGSGAPDAADLVYQQVFALIGPDGAIPGAVSDEEPHFGISLQQYWIGLIGLAGMLFIMVASFVYLKYVSPHNTDQKDR